MLRSSSSDTPGWRTPPARPRSPKRSVRSSAARTRWPTRAHDSPVASSRSTGARVSETDMTATAIQPSAGSATAGVGRVSRVIGPVVDVEFPSDAMPEIYNALHVEVTLGETTRTLTLEVAQHLGDNLVRAISMQPTDGMVRGAPVTDTGEAISVPVGDITKGHVFN